MSSSPSQDAIVSAASAAGLDVSNPDALVAFARALQSTPEFQVQRPSAFYRSWLYGHIAIVHASPCIHYETYRYPPDCRVAVHTRRASRPPYGLGTRSQTSLPPRRWAASSPCTGISERVGVSCSRTRTTTPRSAPLSWARHRSTRTSLPRATSSWPAPRGRRGGGAALALRVRHVSPSAPALPDSLSDVCVPVAHSGRRTVARPPSAATAQTVMLVG